MNSKLLIRNAEVTDATKIIAYLNQVGCESNYLSFGKEGFNKSVEEEVEWLKQLQESNHISAMFLGFIEDELVSIFTLIQMDKERFQHIGEMGCSVKKQYWNQKVGSRMLKHLISYAQASEPLRIITLETLTCNTAAVALYKKFGFKVYGLFEKWMHLDGCDYDSYYMNLYL